MLQPEGGEEEGAGEDAGEAAELAAASGSVDADAGGGMGTGGGQAAGAVAPQHAHNRVAWLAQEVVRFSQESGVVASSAPVAGAASLVGKRVGFLLLAPLEHRVTKGSGVEGVLQPGLHQGAVARLLGACLHVRLHACVVLSCMARACMGCSGMRENVRIKGIDCMGHVLVCMPPVQVRCNC